MEATENQNPFGRASFEFIAQVSKDREAIMFGLEVVGTERGPCEDCGKEEQKLLSLSGGFSICGDCLWQRIRALGAMA